MFHEPVDEGAPVVHDLAIDTHLRVLNPGRHRARRGHVNLEPFKPDVHDVAGDLADGIQERLDAHAVATVRSVDEVRREQRSKDLEVALFDGGGDGLRGADNRVAVFHAAVYTRFCEMARLALQLARMKLAFELSQAQADKLRDEAIRLGLSPEDLARAALSDLLSTPDVEFQGAILRVLAKNKDLYSRLA